MFSILRARRPKQASLRGAESQEGLARPIRSQETPLSDLDETIWPVFLAYRKDDGKEVAKWLYDQLHGKPVAHFVDGIVPAEQADNGPKFKVTLDLEILPGQLCNIVLDDALWSARALVLVTSMGACIKLAHDDRLYQEIEWWSKNRHAAPVIVETEGKGERWIPALVRERWPGTEFVEVTAEWIRSIEVTEEERSRVIRRIAAGIAGSERAERVEQVVALKRLVAHNRRLIVGLSATLVLAVFGVGLSIYFGLQAQRNAADVELKAKALGESNRQLRATLRSEREERLKAQFLLALRNSTSLPELSYLVQELVETGPAVNAALMEALSPEHDPQVIELAVNALTVTADPSCVQPLLERMARLVNQAQRVMASGPETPNTRAFIDNTRKTVSRIDAVLSTIGREGLFEFADFDLNLDHLPFRDSLFEGPGLRECRKLVVGHLARAGRGCLPVLIEFLDDPARRLVAIEAIGALGRDARAAGPYLARWLGDRNARVRLATAIALARVGPDARSLTRVLEVLNEHLDDPEAIHAITTLGPSAEPIASSIAQWLIDQTKTRNIGSGVNSYHIRSLIKALVALEPAGPDAVSAMSALLSWRDYASWFVVDVLHELGGFYRNPDLVVPLLFKEVDSTYINAREAAVLSLGKLGRASEKAAVDIVRRVTSKPNVGAIDLQVLAAIGPNARGAEGFLRELVEHDSDAALKAGALRALGQVAGYDDTIWALLFRIANGSDGVLRVGAEDGLRSYIRRHREAQDQFADALMQKTYSSLLPLTDRVVAPGEFFVGADGVELKSLRLHVFLLRIVKDESRDPAERARAITALGRTQVRVEETVREILTVDAESAKVATARSEFLHSVVKRSPNIVPVLAAHLATKVENTVVYDLYLAGPSAMSALPILRSIARSNEDAKLFAIMALGAIGEPARGAETDLVSILAEASDHLEQKAANALREIKLSPRALDEVFRIATDTTRTLPARIMAADVLRALDDEPLDGATIAMLVNNLSSDDWILAKYSYIILAQKLTSARDELVRALSAPNPRVHKKALQLLYAGDSVEPSMFDRGIPFPEVNEFRSEKLAARLLLRAPVPKGALADSIARSLPVASGEAKRELLRAIPRRQFYSKRLLSAVAAEVRSGDATTTYVAEQALVFLIGCTRPWL